MVFYKPLLLHFEVRPSEKTPSGGVVSVLNFTTFHGAWQHLAKNRTECPLHSHCRANSLSYLAINQFKLII